MHVATKTRVTRVMFDSVTSCGILTRVNYGLLLLRAYDHAALCLFTVGAVSGFLDLSSNTVAFMSSKLNVDILFYRSDTVRYALDILSILTVIPKTQLLLAENVAVLDEGGSTISTVGEGFLNNEEIVIFFVFQVGIENYRLINRTAITLPILSNVVFW